MIHRPGAATKRTHLKKSSWFAAVAPVSMTVTYIQRYAQGEKIGIDTVALQRDKSLNSLCELSAGAGVK
jgi:hypothetical protein